MPIPVPLGARLRRSCCIVLATLAIVAGCSSAPRDPTAEADLWQDAVFDAPAHAVAVDTADLFRLDPGLLQALHEGSGAAASAKQRRAQLLELVFGSEMKAFRYAGGHSTVAADTWRRRSGDCLSLSIMTLALARALDLRVQVQEVQIPPAFDRRGGVDFLNAHVNVLLRNDQPLQAMNRWLPAGDIVIDFEPQPGTRQRGVALSDTAILSRFLNNLAAEHLAAGRDALAYAHFKAAIVADPSYAAAYSNLAQLYLRAGLSGSAEALLRRALALDTQTDLALGSLHRLLLAQGRDAEAADIQRQLLARRERDPYYWLGLGIERLRQARLAEAIDALERAQELTTGFEEVHRYLAIAYWHHGDERKAREQLAVLGAIDGADGSLALLSRKFKNGGADARRRGDQNLNVPVR